MISISRASWHYLFINKYSDYSAPRDLCRYCRKLVTMICVGILMGVVVGFIALLVLSSWWSMLHYYVLTDGWDFDGIFGEPLTVICLIFQVAIVLLVVIVQVATRIRKWFRNLPDKEPTPPWLITLWWKAHRDKICPGLTFSQH